MEPRFAQLPRALAERAVFVRCNPDSIDGGVPLLLAHPQLGWNSKSDAPPTPRPVVLWLHGRTVNKELDPGRYLRWLRAGGAGSGLGVCAIDLPGHGERLNTEAQHPDRVLDVVEKATQEIDGVVEFLADARWKGAFDVSRMAIGGMSAGGMVTLARLCSSHRFLCAAVESTAGDFEQMRSVRSEDTGAVRFPAGKLLSRLNPMNRLSAWRPVPLLALHSEKDEWVPVAAIRAFVARLKDRYAELGADPALVDLVTWPETGAPNEHAGFGRVANDAKNVQTAFLAKHLLSHSN